MKPFDTLTSVAAPMPDADIDTDIIFPARFLLRTDKHGLGGCAFYDKRFDAQGQARPGFVLDREPWRGAQILVAGPNFGCGSSREQAPWALADLGLRCIIAPGFGEIFRANCVANGLLPIVLDRASHQRVLRDAEAERPITVDLMGCTIELGSGEGRGEGSCKERGQERETIAFELPRRQREALLAGLDEIGLIQRSEAEHIAAFELRHRERMPWLCAD